MNKLVAIVASSLLLSAFTAACGDDSAPAPGDDGGGGSVSTDPARHWAQSEMERMVTYLASDELQGRDEGTPGNQLARDFILAEYQRCGIQPLNGSYEQPIMIEQPITTQNGKVVTTGQGVNLLGVIQGTDPDLAQRNIIISAHYDHLGVNAQGEVYNGAEDNAAAVGVTLAVACALAENPPKKSVIIANWDAEEPPTWQTEAMGSMYYVAHPVVPLELTDMMISLELVGGDLWEGYPSHFVIGAELSSNAIGAIDAVVAPDGLIARRLGLHLVEEFPTGHQPWSDYDPFRNAGIPAMMIVNSQQKHYHTVRDDITKINFPKQSLQSQYLFDLVSNLANDPAVNSYVASGNDYMTDVNNSIEVLAAALGPGGLVEQRALTADSRANLDADLAKLTALRDQMTNGATLSASDIRVLRDGVQRMMCHTSSEYVEAMCNLF